MNSITHTIQSLENAKVFNILQAAFICNTGQAVGQATGFKLEKPQTQSIRKIKCCKNMSKCDLTGKFHIKTINRSMPLNTSHI